MGTLEGEKETKTGKQEGKEGRQTGYIGKGTNKKIGKDAWTDGQTDQRKNMDREVKGPIVGGQREKQDEWQKEKKKSTPMVHRSGVSAEGHTEKQQHQLLRAEGRTELLTNPKQADVQKGSPTSFFRDRGLSSGYTQPASQGCVSLKRWLRISSRVAPSGGGRNMRQGSGLPAASRGTLSVSCSVVLRFKVWFFTQATEQWWASSWNMKTWPNM